MLNYEKYKEKIKHYKGLPMCYVCDKLLGIGCKGQGTCIEKNIKVLDFLLSEEEKEKEPIKLTYEEYSILGNIDKEFNWISRDSDNLLVLYQEEPIKDVKLGCFLSPSLCASLPLKNMFRFIKWEDKKAHNINEILNNFIIE